MNTARIAGLTAALSVFGLAAGMAGRRSWAVSPTYNPTRATLKGLTGMAVAVEGLSADAEKAGVTRARVRTEVELRLRQAGIRVLETQSEQSEAPGTPCLTVNLNVLAASLADQPPLVFSVLVELKQRCVLERDAGTTAMATTWKTGCVFRGGVLREQASEVVGEMVDDFLNDYLAVNPKAASR